MRVRVTVKVDVEVEVVVASLEGRGAGSCGRAVVKRGRRRMGRERVKCGGRIGARVGARAAGGLSSGGGFGGDGGDDAMRCDAVDSFDLVDWVRGRIRLLMKRWQQESQIFFLIKRSTGCKF